MKDFGDWVQGALGRSEPTPSELQPDFVSKFTLDVSKVIERERVRGPPTESPALMKAIFLSLCWTLDILYEGRPIQKFFVLETIARLPYFSFTAMLQLYESLGWWRTPQLRDIHHAEEHNELHHLLIMESLGGDQNWLDRSAAQFAALSYFWVLLGTFAASPELAYNFSVLVEEHAYVTYCQFVEENEELLRRLPAPPVAIEYYRSGDLYYFDKFQTRRAKEGSLRRPPCDNLFDVFSNIRDDEFEHISTMKACQDWCAGKGPPPLTEAQADFATKRNAWQNWATEVNKVA